MLRHSSAGLGALDARDAIAEALAVIDERSVPLLPPSATQSPALRFPFPQPPPPPPPSPPPSSSSPSLGTSLEKAPSPPLAPFSISTARAASASRRLKWSSPLPPPRPAGSSSPSSPRSSLKISSSHGLSCCTRHTEWLSPSACARSLSSQESVGSAAIDISATAVASEAVRGALLGTKTAR